jgi:hypothetical protein
MSDFKNNFSWSISRHRAFDECQRKYWFLYYGHWGGWNRNAPDRARKIYMLKKMTNRAMWVGTVVHDSLERYLKSRRNFAPMGLEEILNRQRERMREDYRQSLRGEWRRDPKWKTNLFEHYHGVAVPDEAWRNSAEAADDHIRTF